MTAPASPTAEVGEGLRLDADLRLDVDGRRVHLSGAGRDLVLRVERVGDLAHLRQSAGPLGSGRDGLATLAGHLGDAGLTLHVIGPGDVPLATLGRDAGTGVTARLLGGPVSVPSRLTLPVVALVATLALVAARGLRALLRG